MGSFFAVKKTIAIEISDTEIAALNALRPSHRIPFPQQSEHSQSCIQIVRLNPNNNIIMYNQSP